MLLPTCENERAETAQSLAYQQLVVGLSRQNTIWEVLKERPCIPPKLFLEIVAPNFLENYQNPCPRKKPFQFNCNKFLTLKSHKRFRLFHDREGAYLLYLVYKTFHKMGNFNKGIIPINGHRLRRFKIVGDRTKRRVTETERAWILHKIKKMLKNKFKKTWNQWGTKPVCSLNLLRNWYGTTT